VGGIAPTVMSAGENRVARHLKHDGVRVGEIIAYRAWRVIHPWWFRSGDDRLHSVLMKDYVWHPDEPASGDVTTHGIYSFRNVIRSKEEYYYSVGSASLLFGRVKIWGEVVEHEAGYRSQFGKIVSLDYGDPELLEKFRRIYRVNQVPAGNYPVEDGGRLIW
jgi:hypothetical protein